jgi:hypothetical protein
MASKLQQPTSSVSTPADPPRDFIILGAGSDTALPYSCRAISFGTDGDIKVTTLDGNDLTILSGSLAVGVQHSMQLTKVWATGTTAAKIIAWY